MRRPLLTRYDALLLTVAALFVTVVLVAYGRDLRTVSAILGVATFALLTWRLVSTWPDLTVLEHALATLLALSPLVGALAQANLIRVTDTGLPSNPWLWTVIAHRAGCIIAVVFWTRWLGRRHSPFRR